MRLQTFSLLCLALTLVASPSFAGWAELDSEQAVSDTNPNPNAFGTGFFELNSSEESLTYRITVTGLSGDIVAAHFHGPANVGENAGVYRTIPFIGNQADGVWKSTDASQPLTPAIVEELKNGRVYVNIHTASNSSGEIRGQVNLEPTWNASLDQEQVIPTPNLAAGAAGTAFFVLANTNTELRYSVTVTGLSGAITVAHVHGPSAVGVNSGPVRALVFDGNHASGTWSIGDSQPFTQDRLSQLMGELLYVNVHTALNPGGEIRGQITGAQPSSVSNWENQE